MLMLFVDPCTIQPHYDSLLVKCTTRGATFEIARRKMLRALVEFRIRGAFMRQFWLVGPISDILGFFFERTHRCEDEHPLLVQGVVASRLCRGKDLDYRASLLSLSRLIER